MYIYCLKQIPPDIEQQAHLVIGEGNPGIDPESGEGKATSWIGEGSAADTS